MAQTVIHHTYTSSPTEVLTRIIWTIAGIIEGLLGLRFLLLLFGANPNAAFSSFIYSLSQPFAFPFNNIFRTMHIAGFGTLDWNMIIAIMVYSLIAWAIVRLLNINPPTDHIDYVERV